MANAAGTGSADQTTARPKKYETLAAALEARARSMQAHESLPTERELMQEFGVSRMTVRQALSLLIAQGSLYSVHGSGTYVAHPDMVSKTLRLTGFSEDMRQRGLRPDSRVLSSGTTHASADKARRLDLEPGAELVTVQRLRLANDIPMALELVDLVADVVADWDQIDLNASLYDQLGERGVHIVRASQSIGAYNLDAEQARHLGQAVGAAAVRVSRVSVSDRGRPVEYAETLYRGDRYSFDIVVERDAR
jgi:GntR family transcriptional regulator